MTDITKHIETLKELREFYHRETGINCEENVEYYEALSFFIDLAQKIKEDNTLSLCPKCYCMTKNICGKCKEIKEEHKR